MHRLRTRASIDSSNRFQNNVRRDPAPISSVLAIELHKNRARECPLNPYKRRENMYVSLTTSRDLFVQLSSCHSIVRNVLELAFLHHLNKALHLLTFD